MSIATISIKLRSHVLIVEDNADRIHWFRKKMPCERLSITGSPEVAIEILKQVTPESFSAIFLDYDLGPEPIKFSTITSKTVVDYLNQVCITRQSQRNIIIHSGNTEAADWANAILPGAFKLPFGTFTIEEKEYA